MKLVAESGVGTIAAGVAKAKADLIVISGAEGGTGASPASSIRYAGISPELGLSETQQTLVLNGLRGQVMLQVDGQLKTGRDIILMAMLGAEEFGFATSALIVLGCVMMRKCHQNTCPVGVATQNEKLRKRFRGRSEYLVNFFTFLAQEVREYLAEIGLERLDDIIGRTDLIVRKPDDGIRKHQLISFDKLLARVDNEAAIRHVTDQQHGIDHVKDVEMIDAAAEAVENQKEISLEIHHRQYRPCLRRHALWCHCRKIRRKRAARTYAEREVQRLGRAEFRGIPCPGCQLQAGRRGQRLSGQRSEWRTHRRPASVSGATSRPRKTRLQATPCFMAPQAVKFTSTAVQASALPSATPVQQP